MLVSRNSVTYDTESGVFTSGDRSAVLPDVSVHSIFHKGLGQVFSSEIARAVPLRFKSDYAKAHNCKIAEVPADAVPDAASDDWQRMAGLVHSEFVDKLFAGWELNAREGGSGDPLADECEAFARDWFTKVGVVNKFFTPVGKNKLGRDEDPITYRDFKTFGDALGAFMASSAPVAGRLVILDNGKPWLPKHAKGTTITELIAQEGERRLAAKRNKSALGVAEGELAF